MKLETLASLDVVRATDRELVASLRQLVRADRTLSALMLVHIAEVDSRGLYREQAYSSMFAYCVEELRMSEAEAYLRIQAARLGRQFPLVIELFAKGSLHLSAIKLIGPHLTAENHARLLEQASGKSKREVEQLVASISPKPDVPSAMRKLPEVGETRANPNAKPIALSVTPTSAAIALPLSTATNATALGLRATPTSIPSTPVSPAAPILPQPSSSPTASQLQEPPPGDAAERTDPAAFALQSPRPSCSSTPLSPGRYKVQFTAGQALHDKLDQLKDLLRHQVPDGDLATIVELAVDMLVDDTLKKRFAQATKPRRPRVKRTGVKRRKLNSRYVPRAVVREVHARDAGQCTFVSSDGKRCGERGFLEFHHHLPFARGGKSTVENLRLVCRAHNALFAERDFGTAFIRSKLQHGPNRDATSSST